MKKANELTAPIAAGNIPAYVGKPQELKTVDTGTAQVVNALFRELQACFPAWKQAWPTDEAMAAAKKTWIKGFAADGITTIEQIRLGIEQCRRSESDFMPSVGRFIVMCKPTAESLGLPSEDAAYREACRNAHPSMTGAKWSHAAVFHAAKACGFYNLNTLSMTDSRKLFNRNYAITVRDVLDGKPLKEIPLALPESVKGRITPEVGRAALAALRGVCRG